jgi:hypothetical protein
MIFRPLGVPSIVRNLMRTEVALGEVSTLTISNADEAPALAL